MCIVPKFIIDWFMIMLLLVLKLLVSSHPLNFKGVLAFMFCYFIKDKLNTTLLCFLYAKKQTVAFNALLFMLFCLSYFSCYNIVAKFYCLELYLSCLCLRVLWSQLQCFYINLIKIVSASCHIKNYFCYHLPTRGRAGVKLGDADTLQTYL